jgi:C4-dicarboxylate-specific signal transduction histidine kinase
MIDPKMVELAPFNGLPHLICPVVTEAKKASFSVNWVVSEMEDRYRLLAKVGARNIDSYNEKQEKIPYIVVIVDEFADLMNVAKEQIEKQILELKATYSQTVQQGKMASLGLLAAGIAHEARDHRASDGPAREGERVRRLPRRGNPGRRRAEEAPGGIPHRQREL